MSVDPRVVELARLWWRTATEDLLAAQSTTALPFACCFHAQLEVRGYDKTYRGARTIADLEASENVKPEHLAEAIQYRSLDRRLWA